MGGESEDHDTIAPPLNFDNDTHPAMYFIGVLWMVIANFSRLLLICCPCGRLIVMPSVTKDSAKRHSTKGVQSPS